MFPCILYDVNTVTADAGKLIGDWLVDTGDWLLDAADWLLVAGEEPAEGVSVVEDADWSVVFAVDGADDVILQELSSDWSPQFLSPSHLRESLMHLLTMKRREYLLKITQI